MKKIASQLFQQLDLVILIAAALLTIVGYVFAEIADEVLEGEAQQYDVTILEMLREPGDMHNPIGPTWLEQTARDITGLGSAAVLSMVTVSVSVYLFLIRYKKTLLLFLVAVIGALLLTMLIKELFARPRPDFMSPLVLESSGSFPSGHALLSTVVYLTIGVLLGRTTSQKRLQIFYILVALIVTLLVSASRVYLGAHYPSDVLGGFTGGLVWALVCWVTAYRLQRKGKIEQQSL